MSKKTWVILGLVALALVVFWFMRDLRESKVGAFCGGIAGIPCPDGLNCELEGSYPDAGGNCVKP